LPLIISGAIIVRVPAIVHDISYLFYICFAKPKSPILNSKSLMSFS
jgi:hypothetical protein